LSNEDCLQLSELLTGLGDSTGEGTRLRILSHLILNPTHTRKEISESLQISPMKLTGHLDKLNRCGIIKTQKRGEIKIEKNKLTWIIERLVILINT
jgi:DNA-binding transcriptional ArsR family regulator